MPFGSSEHIDECDPSEDDVGFFSVRYMRTSYGWRADGVDVCRTGIHAPKMNRSRQRPHRAAPLP